MPEYPASLPWLKPADPAAHLLEGFRAGAQISEANARLAESARTADIGFQLDQERLQQQARKEQQEIEVQKAYHQQTTDLKAKQLKQAKDYNDARIKQAADRYGQQQQIQKKVADIHAAVNAGTMTKEEGDNQIARLAVETSMGTPQAPAALRAAQAAEPAQAPQMGQSPTGQEYFYGKNFRLGQRPKEAPSVKQYSPAQANQLLQNQPAWLTDADKATLTKIAKTGLTGSTSTGTTPGAATAQPLPKSKDALVKGQVYQTKHGLGTWDGEKFVSQ